MLNFNHERFAGIVMAVRGARACIEESVAVREMHLPTHPHTIAHTFRL